MYMSDIKLFAKNEKELEILIQIIRIYKNRIWHKKMYQTNHKEWKKSDNGINRTAKSGKNLNT